MHLFFPSLPNQIRPQGGTDPTIQHAMQLNPNQFSTRDLNPQFPAPPMANFNNQNTNLSNFSRNPMGTPNQLFSMSFLSLSKGHNVPPMAQNNEMGILAPPRPFGMNQAMQALNQAMAWQLLGQQNLNFLASLQPGSLFLANNLPQNINPIVGLPNEQARLQNLVMQGNQISALNIPSSSHPAGSNNPGFVVSSHMAMNNPNTNIGNVKLFVDAKKNTMGQSGKPTSQRPMQNRQKGKNMQRSGHWQRQVNSIEGGERNVNSGNLHGYGKKESSRMRFQKSQFHHSKKANGIGGPINKPGRRGQDKRGEGNPQAAIPSKPAKTGSKRCLPVNKLKKKSNNGVKHAERTFQPEPVLKRN